METIIKECPKHGFSEHVLQKNGTYKCKECRKDAVIDIRRRNKIKLVEYKGGKCENCGYDKCIDALEFHHLDPNEKEFGISCGETRSFEKLKEEADKCILVCANCHREIHSIEREEKLKEKYEAKINNELNYNSKIKHKQSKNLIYEKVNSSEFNFDVDNKMSKKELCEKYDISMTTLRRVLEKNGKLYNENDIKTTNNINIEDFLDKFIIYGSFVKVGEYYGFSDNAIKKWCRKNNIPDKKSELIQFIKKYKENKQ